MKDPENGTVTEEPDKDEYEAGEEVTLTVTPDEGYELDEVLVNGEPVEVGEDGTVKITVDGDTKVEVTIKTLAEEPEQPGTGVKGLSGLWYLMGGLGAVTFLALRKKEETEE